MKHFCRDCYHVIGFGESSLCRIRGKINYGSGRVTYRKCEDVNRDGMCDGFKQKPVLKGFRAYFKEMFRRK